MSYRLISTGPCTVLIGGKQHDVNPGDTLHVSDEEGQQIISGGYSRYFTVIAEQDPDPPTTIASSALPISLDQQLAAPIATIEGDENSAPAAAGRMEPDSAQSLIQKYAEDGNSMLNSLVPQKKTAKSSRKTTKETEEVISNDKEQVE